MTHRTYLVVAGIVVLTIPIGSMLRLVRSNPEAEVGLVTATGSMTVPRSAHTSALLSDGTVLITGGMSRSEQDLTPSAETYDPSAGAFRRTGDMSIGRASHRATLLSNGQVLITGGVGSLRDTELYNPATREFSSASRMVVGRTGHTATRLADGRVLILGGTSRGWTFPPEAEIFDPTSGVFSTTGSLITPRVSHTATLLPDGRVLVIAGHQGRGRSLRVLSSVEVYDPETERFAEVGTLIVPRHKHGTVLLRTGEVLVMGGSNENDLRGRYRSAEVYDPASGTSAPTADMNLERFKIRDAGVLLPTGEVLIGGGAVRADVYDPESRTFARAGGKLGLELLFSSASLLPSGDVLITGGYDERIASKANAWVFRRN